MIILALDPGFNLGWALGNSSGELLSYGALKSNPKEPDGKRFIGLRNFVQALITMHKPDMVVVEQVCVVRGTFTKDTYKLYKNYGDILELCYTNDLEAYQFTPSALKSGVTGNGKASKQEVIDIVNKRFKLNLKNDNIADAIALFLLYVDELEASHEKEKKGSRGKAKNTRASKKKTLYS